MASRLIAVAEPLYLLAIAPLLLFPTFRPAWTTLALAGLILVWLARAVLRREIWPVTPQNCALLFFCLTIPLAVLVTNDPDLTIAKLTVLILGLASFRSVVLVVQDRRGLAAGLAVFGVLGLGIWGIGLLGMGLSFLQPLVQRLPSTLVSLIGGADRAVNPNTTAGALVPYLPLTATFALAGWRAGRKRVAVFLGLIAAAVLATLLLSASRASLVGSFAAITTLAWFFVRHEVRSRGSIVMGTVLALILLAVLIAGSFVVVGTLPDGALGWAAASSNSDDVMHQLSLDTRVEIWSRAILALEDFPFTGVGFGTFRRVVMQLYPPFLVPPDTNIGHAHNFALQLGVDQGLGGIIGYLAIVLVSGTTAWQMARSANWLVRYSAFGLFAALVGLHVYGIGDAFESKPFVVLWVLLGLIAALPRVQAAEAGIRP